ncbi:hypothetical protein HHL28_13855 [Aerophototrophica crusticola]|uniref:Rap1a immunity protein domain-containing protein n=2 Tax=Aerophototrophica crusticola TaxID=1709002 RepID=A0A858R9I8_9PROT|nr:hypothetical protein HHL28_13855 [Rhodospirillaceae bacterium B3]
MGMRAWLPVAALVLLAAPAEARDKGGNYAVYAPSCEEVNAGAKEQAVRYGVLTWVQGFLTAFNYAKDETWDILPMDDLDPVVAGMFDYCRENPKDDLAAAAEVMVEEFWSRRLKALPPG